MVAKLLERCPLKYSLVRYLAALTPRKLVSGSTDSGGKFDKILQALMNANWRTSEQCDELLSQYKGFCVDMRQQHVEEFKAFSPDKDNRLDTFLCKYMKGTTYEKFWKSPRYSSPSHINKPLLRGGTQ